MKNPLLEIPAGESGRTAEVLPAEPLQLLVVEDHADTAMMLARFLEMSGFAVRSAASVAKALQLAGEEKFDLLVSDIGLPDASGYDLMRQLRERFPEMTGIAMSGYGMEEDVRRSLDAGFCEHLVKPVSVAVLVQTIQRVVVRR